MGGVIMGGTGLEGAVVVALDGEERWNGRSRGRGGRDVGDSSVPLDMEGGWRGVVGVVEGATACGWLVALEARFASCR